MYIRACANTRMHTHAHTHARTCTHSRTAYKHEDTQQTGTSCVGGGRGGKGRGSVTGRTPNLASVIHRLQHLHTWNERGAARALPSRRAASLALSLLPPLAVLCTQGGTGYCPKGNRGAAEQGGRTQVMSFAWLRHGPGKCCHCPACPSRTWELLTNWDPGTTNPESCPQHEIQAIRPTTLPPLLHVPPNPYIHAHPGLPLQDLPVSPWGSGFVRSCHTHTVRKQTHAHALTRNAHQVVRDDCGYGHHGRLSAHERHKHCGLWGGGWCDALY